MKIYLAGFALALISLGAGCAAVSVDAEPAGGVDLSQYKTWNWLPKAEWSAPAIADPDPRARKRFKDAVEGAFAARGLDRTSRDPDFLVVCRMTEEEVSGSGYRGPGAEGGYLWRHRGSVAASPYSECLVIMEFFDAKTREQIWKGQATCSSPEDGDAALTAALDSLLARFGGN